MCFLVASTLYLNIDSRKKGGKQLCIFQINVGAKERGIDPCPTGGSQRTWGIYPMAHWWVTPHLKPDEKKACRSESVKVRHPVPKSGAGAEDSEIDDSAKTWLFYDHQP